MTVDPPVTPRERQRVDVLGVGVSAVSMDAAVGMIAEWIKSRRQEYVCVTGVHGVMESRRDPALREIHNASGMTTPDGMPMVWAGRRAGASWMTRVYGPDLLLAVLERSVAEGWRSYFYGGAPGVADDLATRMRGTVPRSSRRGHDVAGVPAGARCRRRHDQRRGSRPRVGGAVDADAGALDGRAAGRPRRAGADRGRSSV